MELGTLCLFREDTVEGGVSCGLMFLLYQTCLLFFYVTFFCLLVISFFQFSFYIAEHFEIENLAENHLSKVCAQFL